MKLKQLLSILHPETIVRLMDDDKLDLALRAKDIPKELKERKVNELYKSYLYDLRIILQV